MTPPIPPEEEAWITETGRWMPRTLFSGPVTSLKQYSFQMFLMEAMRQSWLRGAAAGWEKGCFDGEQSENPLLEQPVNPYRPQP